MNQIRAFIGHSFTEDDAEVVGAFLKYFSQLQRSQPGFSWEHAEPAEPKVLAEKVMDLLADKNVFIGICTKKERVIAPQELKNGFFRRELLHASAERFEWKTSDWIIQEIGLARGRGMDLILLVERGVRQPGGLQGNVEYISFDRSLPEKSFGRIVEMIAALSPRPPAAMAITSTTPPVTDEEKEEEASGDEKWAIPQPTWKRKDYEVALMRATHLEQTALIKSISDAYLETESGGSDEHKQSWAAFEIFVRLVLGKEASLADLQATTTRFPENSSVLDYLGRAYEHYKNFENAGDAYRKASSKSTQILVRLSLLRRAVMAYQKAGKADVAASLLASMRDFSGIDAASQKEVLKAQKEVAEATGDDELVLAVLERIVDLSPDDEDSRFALAYKHSELGNESLALFHYLRIPDHDREEGTWNNLGVALDRLELPGKSVVAYRMAESLGNTLAMSNLAHKLMNAGFLSEAKEICDRALARRDVHKNVSGALARLMEIPDEETKKEDEFLKSALPVSEFYCDLGRAAAQPEPSTLSGKWRGPKCTLEVEFSNSTLRCVGEYEKDGLGLLGLALLGSGLGPSTDGNRPFRYRVEYQARALGSAFLGTISESRIDPAPERTTLLGSDKDDTRVSLALSDDGRHFQVMEKRGSNEPRLYRLTCISN